MRLIDITGQIIDASLKVHSALGPGLLENVYRICLIHELNTRGLKTASEIWLPIVYDGVTIESGLRLDLLVEDEVIVELKAAEAMLPVFKAQLLSYLRLSGKKVGLLINFHCEHLRDGIRRVVNGDIPAEELFSSVNLESSVSSVLKARSSSSSK